AVAEEDRLAADRQVEPVGPIAYARLRRLLVEPEDGLALRTVGRLVPALPARLLDAALDRERAHRLDEVDRPRAEAIEVAGEERVRAAELAGAAHRAVDVVARDVLDPEVALLHRDDVRVKRGRRVGLVAGHLRDRADLAAELVAGAEAVVRGVPPLRDELVRRRCHR